MKNIKTLILPLFLLGALSGCAKEETAPKYTWHSGDKVFYEKIVFDTSDAEAKDPNIYLGTEGKVESVKVGRSEVEFGYNSKVLTLSAEGLKAVGAGEKNAIVTFDDGKKQTVEIFNATKMIKTAQDFQDIGKDEASCQGYYMLANDIDCSSITNFEPIGRFASEEDPDNFYFHGVLDGNGYAIKNVTCSYSDSPTAPTGGESYPSNYDVYSGNPKFSGDSHQAGDNIGIFQVIGSSGVVRNIAFDNCKVHGRTIVGVIAGNIMGTAQNVLINSNCSVKMDTHFYDDDCNTGAAFGIVAGSGNVSNIISLTTQVSILEFYQDYNDTYKTETGNNWDHGPEPNENPWWRFVGVDKELPDKSGRKLTDNNGSQSNGVYSVVGKCWGMFSNSIGAKFKVTPYDGETRDVFFGHTHTGVNKPTSGEEDLGTLQNCAVYDATGLKTASNYNGFDTNIWNINEGSLPTLKQDLVSYSIAQ